MVTRRMVLFAASIVFCFASVRTLAAETATGPSAGHPLSPLCDMICGGTWQPDHPAYPDEIRTGMTFAWDAESGTIRGTSTRSGGNAGIRQVMTITYAYDPATDAIIQTRAPDPADWSQDGRDPPESISSKVTLAGNGFSVRTDNPYRPGEAMITAVRFETPDLWVERSEIVGNGQSTLGAELRYARNAE